MLKELLQVEKKQENYKMGKLTGKGKPRVKVGNHPHTNMVSKPKIVMRVLNQRSENFFCKKPKLLK